MTATYYDKRCRAALRLSDMATRCKLPEGHEGTHVAQGLIVYPDQLVEWESGHRWEFMSDRPDEWAWEW